MPTTKAHLGHYFIAASISLLAASIFYFSEKLNSLEKAANSLSVYHDVAPDLVDGLAAISQQIPAMVSEVEQTRQQLPKVLAEVAAIRNLIPVVVDQIPPILAESAALRKDTIPSVLAESSALRKNTIPAVLSESKALRKDTIPALITEIEASREAMPVFLAQANEIARTAGKNASEGAVSGFFSGIIKAPINLVNGVSGSAFKGHSLTKRDQELLTHASERVLDMNKLNATEDWQNPDNNRRGTVTLTEMVVAGDERCRELTFKGFSGRRSLGTETAVICHDEKGVWKLKE